MKTFIQAVADGEATGVPSLCHSGHDRAADLPRLIGLTGRKYAGKTEAAKYLEARYGYTGTAITDPMVEMAVPLLRHMGIADEEEINDRLQPWGKRKDDPIAGFPWLTGRKILQSIGRDTRDVLSRPVASSASVNSHGTDGRLFYDLWLYRNASSPRLVNQSVRYPFEGDIIRASGGIVWRIVNPDDKTPQDNHPSESQDWEVDRTIVAPHSLGVPYLHDQIEAALSSFGKPDILS